MSTAARKIPDLKSMDLPYTLRVYGMTEEMFDEIVEDAGRKQLGLVLGAANALARLKTARKVAPDVFFVSRERVPSPLPKQFERAPDLVVEILSRSNRSYDLGEKRAAYQAAGVSELWFVDPEEKSIILDRRRDANYVCETFDEGPVTSEVVEGFWLDASWLWKSPLPDPLSCLDAILGRV